MHRLIEDLKKVLWKHGFHAPERLKHHVDPHGDHRIELAIQAKEADYEPPRRVTAAASFGATTSSFSTREGK